jgi:hypothetical protein
VGLIHLTIERPTKGRFANVSHNIARLVQAIFLKLQESNFLLYATRFSMMRSLVKRLGMGLPNNLLPEFPAITGSLIDRSIDLLLIFLKKYAWQPMQSLTESIDQSASRLIY